MTRQQIETLMAPLKQDATASRSQFAAPEKELAHDTERPVVPPGIDESFLPVRGGCEHLIYRPALLGQARTHFVDRKSKLDHWDDVSLIRLAGDSLSVPPWDDAEEWDEEDLPELLSEPCAPNAEFRDLPAEVLKRQSYTTWKKQLKDFLYRHHHLSVWYCEALKAGSQPGESESDFRIRLRHQAREQRDLKVEKLRARYASRFATIEDQLRRARQRIEKEKSQRSEKGLSAAISVGTSILGALFGRKLRSTTNVNRAGSAIRSASRVAKEQEDIRHAQEQYAALAKKREELTKRVEEEVQTIHDELDLDLMEFQERQIAPRKSDLAVDRVTLVWLPYRGQPSGSSERAF